MEPRSTWHGLSSSFGRDERVPTAKYRRKDRRKSERYDGDGAARREGTRRGMGERGYRNRGKDEVAACSLFGTSTPDPLSRCPMVVPAYLSAEAALGMPTTSFPACLLSRCRRRRRRLLLLRWHDILP